MQTLLPISFSAHTRERDDSPMNCELFGQMAVTGAMRRGRILPRSLVIGCFAAALTSPGERTARWVEERATQAERRNEHQTPAIASFRFLACPSSITGGIGVSFVFSREKPWVRSELSASFPPIL